MSDLDQVQKENEYLTFFVARQEYALDVLRVREVIATAPITPIPSAAREVRGVVNLRGNVVPVIDLALRLGVGELVPTKRTCIVVIEPDGPTGRVVGLLVDSVNRVIALASGAVASVPTFGTAPRADLLAGMSSVGPSFVLILTPQRVALIEQRPGTAAP